MVLSLVTLLTGISIYERGRPPQEGKEVKKSNTDEEEAAAFVVKEEKI